jgi:hypothetical protein
MGIGHRERCMRRRRMWLILGAVVLCVAGTFLALVLTQGLGRLVRFMTVPSLEAISGRKYTPGGAVRRYIDKRNEEKPQN